MIVEVLHEDGVTLLLLDQCFKVVRYQGDDKTSAKLHCYNRVFTRATEKKYEDFIVFKQQMNKNSG